MPSFGFLPIELVLLRRYRTYFSNVLSIFTVYIVVYLMAALAVFELERTGTRNITRLGTIQMLLGGLGLLQTICSPRLVWNAADGQVFKKFSWCLERVVLLISCSTSKQRLRTWHKPFSGAEHKVPTNWTWLCNAAHSVGQTVSLLCQ